MQKRYKEILVKTRIIFFENLFRRRYYFHSLPTIFVIIRDFLKEAAENDNKDFEELQTLIEAEKYLDDFMNKPL